jgi:hypothetical protein
MNEIERNLLIAISTIVFSALMSSKSSPFVSVGLRPEKQRE